MLSHKENFSATGKNSNDVGIGVCLSSSSHVLFCTEELVESFYFGMFVDKDDLSTILDHTMCRIAKKGEDSLVGFAFEEAS